MRGPKVPDPKILILTDGKIGDLVQCRGVAARLSGQENIVEKVVSPDWWHSLPFSFIGVQKGDRRGEPNSPLNDPLPDLVIASGRRTLPYLRAMQAQRSTSQKPLMAFLKDPRSGRGVADFVWAPVHDRLTGKDVLSTHTSPHGLSDAVLTDAAKSAAKRFVKLNAPFCGVVLGGDSGAVKWNEAMSADFANVLRQLPKHETILVTTSRRTPDCLIATVENLKAERSVWSGDGSDNNPYFEILMHSQRLIVTGDSHNMVSECLATGKPVYVFRPNGLQKKLHGFLDAMEDSGAIKPTSDLTAYAPIKLDATVEIADAISRRLADSR